MSSAANKTKSVPTTTKTNVSLPKVNNNNTGKSPAKAAAATAASPNKAGGRLPAIEAKGEATAAQASNKVADSILLPSNTPTDAATTASDTSYIPASTATEAASQPLAETPAADASTTVSTSDPAATVSTSTTDPATSVAVTAPAEPEKVAEPVKRDGEVKLIYEQYNELFPIKNGSTTAAEVDEVYCLSFVMPNCLIHLSPHPPAAKRQLEIEEKYHELFVPEIPRGTFQNLVADQVYYVYVEQESAQLERDNLLYRQRLQADGDLAKPGAEKLTKDDGRVLESCSCIYGNPCVDEYGCKDWANRCAVATKNGWKGFF